MKEEIDPLDMELDLDIHFKGHQFRNPDPKSWKWCPGCQKYVLKIEFSKNLPKKDGLDDYCKKCRNDRAGRSKLISMSNEEKFIFEANQTQLYLGPGIYFVKDLKDSYLYIGKGMKVIHRVMNIIEHDGFLHKRNQKSSKRIEEWPDVKMYIKETPGMNEKRLYAYESALINIYKPKYNVAWKL